MANKPIIKTIIPFDASLGTTIKATYTGNTPFYNRVEIQDASSLKVMYSRTIETSLYEHYIDPLYKGSRVVEGDVAYSLINGRRYTATIQFFDRDMTPGIVSDKGSFLTKSTPQFYIAGVEDGDVIQNSSIQLNLVYSQSENEKLLNYRFSLYDSLKNVLQQTEIMYDLEEMSYIFKGLANETSYYVRAEGTTVNGIPLDTGLINVIVRYENPNTYARMYVDNDPKTSAMNYFTNYKLIESDEDETTFDYEDSYIYMLGRTLNYSSNFEIEGDAIWFIRGKELDRTGVIFTCTNGTDYFEVSAIKTENKKYRYKLIVPSAIGNYVQYSDEFTVGYSDIVSIWIKRIGGVYSLVAFVEQVDEYGNYIFYKNEPTFEGLSKFDIWLNMPDRDEEVVVLKDNMKVYYKDTEPTEIRDNELWIGGE